MLHGFKVMIDSVWFFLNYRFNFDGYRLRPWYFLAFFLLFSVLCNIVFRKKEGD